MCVKEREKERESVCVCVKERVKEREEERDGKVLMVSCDLFRQLREAS